MNEWVMLGIGVVLTVGTGIFVASEFALVNLDRNDLEQRQARGEKRLGPTISALRITSTHLSSAQLGITLTTLLTGYTFEPVVSSLLEDPLTGAGVPQGVVPGVGAVATALGGIPVDRGSGGKESFETAAVALEGGELVCLLPQGTIPRGARFYEPVLKGRTGAARLAAITRAPVIPFGIWGSEHVWPRSSRLPNVLNVRNPPTVRVRVGPPVDLVYRSAAADTRRIMAAIVDCLPLEARERREPTEEEIRLATPGS